MKNTIKHQTWKNTSQLLNGNTDIENKTELLLRKGLMKNLKLLSKNEDQIFEIGHIVSCAV